VNGAEPNGKKRGRRKAEPVTTITPDPLVWSLALQMANGDAKRLRALDSNTVVIANHP
jgi:hypothetical protein